MSALNERVAGLNLRLFERIAHGIDVQPIVARVLKHMPLWDEITVRQRYLGSAHHSTQAIIVRGPHPHSPDLLNELVTVDYPYAKDVRAVVEETVEICLAHIGKHGKLGRVMLVNLRVDGFIDPHADEGRYAESFERFHLALAALPGNRFNVGDHHFTPVSGELWWFNHRRVHSFINLSGADRWHLIIDVQAPSYRSRLA